MLRYFMWRIVLLGYWERIVADYLGMRMLTRALVVIGEFALMITSVNTSLIKPIRVVDLGDKSIIS